MQGNRARGERGKRRTLPPVANVSRLQFEIVISSLGVRPLVDPEQIDGFDLLPSTATDRDWRERKRRTKIPRPQYLEPEPVPPAPPFGVIGPIAGSGDGTTVLKQANLRYLMDKNLGWRSFMDSSRQSERNAIVDFVAFSVKIGFW